MNYEKEPKKFLSMDEKQEIEYLVDEIRDYNSLLKLMEEKSQAITKQIADLEDEWDRNSKEIDTTKKVQRYLRKCINGIVYKE